MAHDGPDVASFVDRHHFLIRRLHSLSGLIPIGVFVVMHLAVNASINVGGAEFQTQVDRIHALGPLLVPVEVLGIFLPILFHALLGFQIWFSGVPNVGTYRYGGNIRYTLQRVTGGIAFVFILYHVWHMHWLGSWSGLGGGFFEPDGRAAETAADAMRQTIWGLPVAILYAVGVLATVYHLANGIWASLITWGVTIGPGSQRASGYACAALGIVLSILGLSSVKGFRDFSGDASPALVDDTGSSATVVPVLTVAREGE